MLTSPRLQPIYFNGFPFSNDIDLFFGRLQQSAYWPAVATEYRVGSPTALAGYGTTVPVPDTTSSDDLPALLSQVFVEGAATLGAPRGDTIYVLFFATTTTITVSGQAACGPSGLSGFHAEWVVAGTKIPVAVIPTCATIAADKTLTGVNVLTPAVSHEVVEAAADPFVDSDPAFIAIDGAHAMWGEAINGSEIADLCENETPNLITPDDLGYPVQRIWSNVGARAGTGPCVPVPAGEVYFNCVAAMPDRASFTNQSGTMFTLPALAAPIGQPVSARVTFHGGSDAPPAWSTVAVELDPVSAAPASPHAPVKGARGQTVSVPVIPAASAKAGVLPLLVGASDGTAFHFWIGAINRN